MRRRRQAAIRAWARESKTAGPDRLYMLASAIVDRLGGYDKAAKEIVAYIRELAESGKAPRRAMDAYMSIVKLMAEAGR